MDRAISHASYSPSSGLVADLDSSYGHLDSNRHRHAPYPSRPSSRLGFNRPELLTCPADAPTESEASRWSHTLFQNVGVPELRLPASIASKMDAAAPVCSSNAVSEDAKIHLSDRPRTVSLSTRTEDELAAPRKSPSVSRLCFPFVTTSRPNKSPPPARPPPRHKYSCFPSLMSPTPASRPFPRYPRHDYRQHGYSRMALQDLKAFWVTRQESWNASDDKAYGGIAQDHASLPAPAQKPIAPTPSPDTVPVQNANHDTVYPRHGDISALRDPYCADIDRCFSGLPLWTINKTLYMHDLHMLAEMRPNGALTPNEEDSYDEYDDEAEVASSASTQFGDDSDTTLVESESEAEYSDAHHTSYFDLQPKKRYCASDRLGETGVTAASTFLVYRSPSKQYSAQLESNWPGQSSQSMKSELRRRTSQTQWPTNWYQRWDLLLNLSRQSGIHDNLLGHSPISPSAS